MMTLDEAIKFSEKVAEELNEMACALYEDEDYEESKGCIWGAEEHRQRAKWLRELKRYREQIQNLIDNESFETVNPFNTYEYVRVVRVADLYDLTEVNADE